MLGHSLLSVLPALVTVTMAVQTASQSKVTYPSSDTCRKQYSPPADYPALTVTIDRNLVTYFHWKVKKDYYFVFWVEDGVRADDIGAHKILARKGDGEGSVIGLPSEFNTTFAD
ncbi:hypothetical protein FOZ63_030294, partial [Perkinsus olseni]